MPEADLEEIKDGIAQKIVERANQYEQDHSALKTRAVEIYHAFIGKFLTDEGPSKTWQSKLYPKMLKPKVMAAHSQFVQAAMANKIMWDVSPRGASTPRTSRAANGMQSSMNEQAEACKVKEKLKSGALDMFMYGSLFWQAPVVETRVKREWVVDMSNPMKVMSAMIGKPSHRQKSTAEDYPSVIHRNYFEMYPWPYSADLQKGEGIIHRPFISAYELSELRDEPGYYVDVIDELLKGGTGNDPAADKTEEKMTARGWGSRHRTGYDLIFFSGRIGAEDLKNLPGFEDQTGRYAEVLIWVVNHSSGPKIIKLAANPIAGKYRPFMMSHYEQLPHESLGVGIGENSVDIAKSIGGAIRLFLDGKKLALPMLGVNTKYFQDNTVEFEPLKIWPFDGAAPKDALFPVQFPDMTTGLLPMIEFLERIHDEITGIPKWTTGVDSKMLNKTATGISMIMNASSQLIRGAIENLDDNIIGPTGERFYDWNMENHPNVEIKGDFIVKASGISSLMQKESLNQQLMGLVSLVINPAIRQDPYAMRLVRMIGDGMNIKDVDSIMPDPDKMREFANASPVAAAQSMAPSVPPGAPVPAAAMTGQGGINV